MRNKRRFSGCGLFNLLKKILVLKLRKHKKMKCRNVQKRLSAYQDGELKVKGQDRIKAHLIDCPECRKQYERLLHIWDALDNLPDIQPRPEFILRVRKRISGTDKKRFFPRLRPIFQIFPSPLAMVTLLLVGLVLGIYLGNVLFEEGLSTFQGRQPRYAQEHVSLASIRTFDMVPPETLAHGYLKMASYQEETH